MRLSKDIQKLADERAQKEGYFCASYYGHDEEKFVFLPMFADTRIRTLGLFTYIVVKNMKARIHRGLNYGGLNSIKERDYTKGRALFREFEWKYDNNAFVNEDERDYISKIVQNQRSSSGFPIERNTLYKFLEIAERFGMRLELEVEEWTKKRKEGREYYVALKECDNDNRL